MDPRREIVELRQILETRFPGTPVLVRNSGRSGGICIDRDHFPLEPGVVTEFISAPSGGGLFLDRMLAATEKTRSFAGLIDASRSFDPNSYASEQLQRLLCIFCETPEKAVKAADLLLRDGNLPLVLLDFQLVTLPNLRRLPANIWHRFQRLVENSGTTFVVLTQRPMIAASRVRMHMVMRTSCNMTALRRRRSDLLEEIELQVFDRRRGLVATNNGFLRTA
jgi:hypothetical protein